MGAYRIVERRSRERRLYMRMVQLKLVLKVLLQETKKGYKNSTQKGKTYTTIFTHYGSVMFRNEMKPFYWLELT